MVKLSTIKGWGYSDNMLGWELNKNVPQQFATAIANCRGKILPWLLDPISRAVLVSSKNVLTKQKIFRCNIHLK